MTRKISTILIGSVQSSGSIHTLALTEMHEASLWTIPAHELRNARAACVEPIKFNETCANGSPPASTGSARLADRLASQPVGT